MEGRSFHRNRYSYSRNNGWVTVSGLRASPLTNVRGILLGEAMTAAQEFRTAARDGRCHFRVGQQTGGADFSHDKG